MLQLRDWSIQQAHQYTHSGKPSGALTSNYLLSDWVNDVLIVCFSIWWPLDRRRAGKKLIYLYTNLTDQWLHALIIKGCWTFCGALHALLLEYFSEKLHHTGYRYFYK